MCTAKSNGRARHFTVVLLCCSNNNNDRGGDYYMYDDDDDRRRYYYYKWNHNDNYDRTRSYYYDVYDDYYRWDRSLTATTTDHDDYKQQRNCCDIRLISWTYTPCLLPPWLKILATLTPPKLHWNRTTVWQQCIYRPTAKLASYVFVSIWPILPSRRYYQCDTVRPAVPSVWFNSSSTRREWATFIMAITCANTGQL